VHWATRFLERNPLSGAVIGQGSASQLTLRGADGEFVVELPVSEDQPTAEPTMDFMRQTDKHGPHRAEEAHDVL
jgi:hypothetical protein